MPKRPLTVRELLKRLKPYGIKVLKRKRGKGSELILLKPDSPGPISRNFTLKQLNFLI